MADKPIWYSQLDAAVTQLEALPGPWVDRATIEVVLRVGRRRAQQILKPVICQTIGKSGLAKREDVIRYLRAVSASEGASFERQRRERLHSLLTRPRVPVEAPVQVVNQALDDLPPGVHLSPGRIVLEGFSTPNEAKQKMLALIMAMGNDPDGFDARIAIDQYAIRQKSRDP